MAKNILATRMELLKLKNKIKLAKKGHKLLKQKRDALVTEFFKLFSKIKATREELDNFSLSAYNDLILLEAYDGIEEVRRLAYSTKSDFNLIKDEEAIMGVKVPKLSLKNNTSLGFSAASNSLSLSVGNNFKNLFNIIIKLVELEKTAELLADEIKKTKRKVNALEMVLIPRLESQVRYIKIRLEEIERENFIRLKVIKASIE